MYDNVVQGGQAGWWRSRTSYDAWASAGEVQLRRRTRRVCKQSKGGVKKKWEWQLSGLLQSRPVPHWMANYDQKRAVWVRVEDAIHLSKNRLLSGMWALNSERCHRPPRRVRGNGLSVKALKTIVYNAHLGPSFSPLRVDPAQKQAP